MSFKLVRKPHMKNSVVTIAIARRPAEVSGAFARTDGVSVTVGGIAWLHCYRPLAAGFCPLARNRSRWDTRTRFRTRSSLSAGTSNRASIT